MKSNINLDENELRKIMDDAIESCERDHFIPDVLITDALQRLVSALVVFSIVTKPEQEQTTDRILHNFKLSSEIVCKELPIYITKIEPLLRQMAEHYPSMAR